MRRDGHARVWFRHAAIRRNQDLLGKVFLTKVHADLHLPVLLCLLTYVPTNEKTWKTLLTSWAEVSASNAITASSYLLLAAGVESTTWKLRGIAIAAAAFAVGIHSVAPRVGRGLQDLLSAVKLFTLLFIVCTGFAALSGQLKVEQPHNFDIHTSFKDTSNNGYNIGTALLSAIFSFQGYDNVNAVLSEVKNPQKTLRIALPTAMGVITVLYLLANVAYFAAVSKDDFLHSDITIAATLFRNVFGESAATRVLPALVAISAIGHLLGIAYTVRK